MEDEPCEKSQKEETSGFSQREEEKKPSPHNGPRFALSSSWGTFRDGAAYFDCGISCEVMLRNQRGLEKNQRKIL